MSRRALLALTVGLAAAACATTGPTPSMTVAPPAVITPGPDEVPSANPSHGPTAPPGSISADQAVAAARAGTSGGAGATILSAVVGDDPFVPGRLAWLVRLQGFNAATCPNADTSVPPPTKVGPSAAPCLDGEGGAWAVVDPVTGTLMGWVY